MIRAVRAAQWRDQFLAAGQTGLKSRAADVRDDDNRQLQAKIGELLMENELHYAKAAHLEASGPLARRRSTRCVAPTRSPRGGRMAGLPRVGTVVVERVCQHQAPALGRRGRPPWVGRRGPRRGPGHPIRRVLDASPFHGGGVSEGLGEAAGRGDPDVKGAGAAADAGARHADPAPDGARARTEGVRRDHYHRGARRDVGHRHDGDSDGGRGTACVFVAIDHDTTECIGLHAAKRGNRFEALRSRQIVKAFPTWWSSSSGSRLCSCQQRRSLSADHRCEMSPVHRLTCPLVAPLAVMPALSPLLPAWPVGRAGRLSASPAADSSRP